MIYTEKQDTDAIGAPNFNSFSKPTWGTLFNKDKTFHNPNKFHHVLFRSDQLRLKVKCDGNMTVPVGQREIRPRTAIGESKISEGMT